MSSLEVGRAAYIAKYVCKKIGTKELAGRRPEFSRMSKKPGLGHDAMLEIASASVTYSAQDRLTPLVTVAGKNGIPVGRYLKGVLYNATGSQPISTGGVRALEKNAHKLQVLRMVAEQCNVPLGRVLKELSNREVPEYRKKGTL